ncbi:MAG: V-type ATP synthase subunit E [Spirochaetes bacterium]|nr:V-type ATP synthase subunit E [Spirochaetota bacterium]
MDIQLKELIEKIRKEGVGEAEEKAGRIIEDAKTSASEIIEKARKEASEIIAKAKDEQAQMENTGKDALKQAGRDLILTIKGKLTSIFDSLVKKEVSGALKDDVISELIPVIIKEWSVKNKGIDVLLSREDGKKLEKSLLNKLSDELKSGVEIKVHQGIKSGFRISEKDGESYYDFTDEGVAESLVQYLNPVLADIITKAVSEK